MARKSTETAFNPDALDDEQLLNALREMRSLGEDAAKKVLSRINKMKGATYDDAMRLFLKLVNE